MRTIAEATLDVAMGSRKQITFAFGSVEVVSRKR